MCSSLFSGIFAFFSGIFCLLVALLSFSGVLPFFWCFLDFLVFLTFSGVLGFLFSLVHTDHFWFFLGCFLTSCDPFYQFLAVNLVGKEEHLGGTILLWGGHG